MDFFSKYNLTPVKVLKVAGIALAGIVVLMIVVQFAGTPFAGNRMGGGWGGFGTAANDMVQSYAPMAGGPSYAGEAAQKLSYRNVAPPIVSPRPGTTGSDAEQYEVTDYTARIETRNLATTCSEVAKLKAREYVIFESASESKRDCSYTFKVAHARAAEILSAIEAFHPKDLTENTYTIKRLVDDFTSEIEILEKKRGSIESTLEDALRAYEEISVLARRSANAEALARAIDSKIGIIERLSQERININAELDRLARAKADQLDRLAYTYFHVSAYENKYIDFESIKDSWKAAVKNLARSVSDMAQTVTVGLIGFFVWLLPVIIYGIILLLLAKYGWRAVRAIWKS